MARDIATLENAIDYRFNDRHLAEQALTHASRSLSPGDRIESNERLEFLGDRVLGLVITEMLYAAYPDDSEGNLSRRLNALVRRETLADVADELDLARHIVMSRGEAEQGGRENPALAADAMEALIAAVHLDGGIDAARQLIRTLWTDRVRSGPNEPPKDAKTSLQEWSQSKGRGLPKYTVISQEGPPHAPAFTVEARLDAETAARATGPSKQKAEQAAAAQLLDAIEGNAT